MSHGDPRTYHIFRDSEGWFLMDDDGYDVDPTRRWSSYANAKAALDEMVQVFLAELFAEYDQEATE